MVLIYRTAHTLCHRKSIKTLKPSPAPYDRTGFIAIHIPQRLNLLRLLFPSGKICTAILLIWFNWFVRDSNCNQIRWVKLSLKADSKQRDLGHESISANRILRNITAKATMTLRAQKALVRTQNPSIINILFIYFPRFPLYRKYKQISASIIIAQVT